RPRRGRHAGQAGKSSTCRRRRNSQAHAVRGKLRSGRPHRRYDSEAERGMKRLILALALVAGMCFAQEHGEEKKETHEAAAEEEGGLEIWKWVNFLILAGGLGYLIGKNAGPFFKARSADIRKDLETSLRQRQEAEARAAEVDRRLATLDREIA